jgi:hypothetical protein
MKIIKFTGKIILLAFFLTIGSCEPEPEVDPCFKTKWPLSKEYEIKLAVRLADTNTQLPGSTLGSQYPAEFKKMTVNGTIEKEECDKQTAGQVSLGNTYITKGTDLPAPIYVSDAWWIGHFVYVYEFDNDKDLLNLNLTLKITMNDGQSFVCNVSKHFYYEDLGQMAEDLLYNKMLYVNLRPH